MRRGALPLLALLLGAAPAAAPIRLALPLACHVGADCVIQSYVDDDPGPEAHDYQCHGRTYQAHDGTDFRIPSMARERAGVAVLAAAPGVVLRVRDGVADISVRDLAPGAVAGEECGNGVVVDHGGGWETQYCHMARGSVAVRPGARVAAGTALGRVGLSGGTEFPHLHLTVRHDGKAVDPFAYGAASGQCGGDVSLWASTPLYRRGEVLVAGFATGPVSMAQAQDLGPDQVPRPTRDMPLVAFIQAIGLAGGDIQHLTLRAPDESILADSPAAPLERDKAQTILFVGKKAPARGWTPGVYRADYSLTRDGRMVAAHGERVTL